MRAIKRRELLRASVLAAGMTIIPSRLVYGQKKGGQRRKSAATSYAANERLNIAGIGVGGRGGEHVGPSLR